MTPRRRTGRPARRLAIGAGLVVGAGIVLGACGTPAPAPTPRAERAYGSAERLADLRNAEVWRAVATEELDLFRGPAATHPPDEPLRCRFEVPHSPPGGRTPKFPCRDEAGRLWKVKYGPGNPEVHAEVAASRLLWALGFFTDRIDPVAVECAGCPEDPWSLLQGIDPGESRPAPPSDTVRRFEPAIVESYFGTRLQTRPNEGVEWQELLRERATDPGRAEQQRIHREALSLAASLLQHGDSKPANHTLACAPGGFHVDGAGSRTCTRPVFYIGDLGATFGRGFRFRASKVDLEAWMDVSVWRDAASCTTRVDSLPPGTLHDTKISEPARRFLAERLAALSRAQIEDLFRAARMDQIENEIERDEAPPRPATLADWADALESKIAEITDHACPGGRS